MSPVLALHIPDGFLSIPVSAVGWLLAVVMIALALRQTRQQFGERQIPLVGILAACIFAGQMLNFPISGGTSGHLIGATFAAILVGPYAAVLIMTCVVGVQGLLFQDGGLLALGFNIFNMGIVAAFIGYVLYRWIWRLLGNMPNALLIGAGVGAWLAVVISAAICAFELAISNASPLNIALPAMVSVHAVIGIGEALITVGALSFIRQTRPDLLNADVKSTQGSGWIAAGLGLAITLALVSPLASPQPDGLEYVAEQFGFLGLAKDPIYTILPDYTVPFVQHEALTTILAGIIGVLVVTGISLVVARLSSKAQQPADDRMANG